MNMDFGEKLTTWYAQNKRYLPWRNTRNPYNIWLSEIILQQTRVYQGMAYYHRFVKPGLLFFRWPKSPFTIRAPSSVYHHQLTH